MYQNFIPSMKCLLGGFISVQFVSMIRGGTLFEEKNWYREEDMNQHMKVIHETPEDAITFSWHGFYETVP